MDRLISFNTFLWVICSKIATALPKIAGGIVVFLASWIIALIARSLIRYVFSRTRLKQRHLLRLLDQVGYLTVLIFGGITTALGTMGINVTALVAGLGLMGFTVGFALKDVLSSVFSGFLILFYEPFQINDRITISNIPGKVIDINLRYTVLQEENKRIMIPNSTVLINIVTKED
ncbi:mechanosensitive ion channel family protein [Coxiella endosymbiont of Ornithodoros maritimus]|uniref:mechanosensitive ion channel family protein n=1 Tax=Coxiella endosymbiont of Ornithodoros maritimus TaxID=1656172 RepID=UPI0022647101|nr:mechanosensitive ion channel domain-containing protein [Coxiella endosymbiont of Ornithodoros maritimus]